MFSHKEIIRRFSVVREITRKVTGGIVAGKPQTVEEKFNIEMACWKIDLEEKDYSNGGFVKGDMKVYILEDMTLKENDTFITEKGHKYIIKEQLDTDYIDYDIYLARRVVDD